MITSQECLQTNFIITPTSEFLQWIHDRLEFKYGENPNYDYMQSLDERIKLLRLLEGCK